MPKSKSEFKYCIIQDLTYKKSPYYIHIKLKLYKNKYYKFLPKYNSYEEFNSKFYKIISEISFEKYMELDLIHSSLIKLMFDKNLIDKEIKKSKTMFRRTIKHILKGDNN